ncbi:MAG: hypothetical protein AAGH79_06920 [Bacteroidota bacterium]
MKRPYVSANPLWGLLLVLFVLSLASCEKDPPEEVVQEEEIMMEENANVYGSIEVSVIWCNLQDDPLCLEVNPIPGAVVTLFSSAEDRQFSDPVKSEKITTASGKVTFNALEGGKRYYLRTNSVYGVQETDDTTPSNGLAFHEVIFTQ